ncbi:Leucine-rich repeat containing protein [Hibiscus syriacus]|uniref:Leucine-rich repeat containing protein n=1 Tax=Hibiscus syriacus TaxID=106335 RepID=A0A6A3BCF2_HIBSY|nr:Leucine-rich repeat containing protein [Hibiscus syriacus]
MGETFLFNIAERVLEKVVKLSVEEVRLAFNVKTDLGKLMDTMSSIKAVLLDAERQQHRNEKLRLCMSMLKMLLMISSVKLSANMSSIIPTSASRFATIASSRIVFHFEGTLPEGMDCLAELRELNIKQCPELSRRYRRDGGADWHKIAHIQEVRIKDNILERVVDFLTLEEVGLAFNVKNNLRRLKETMSSSIKAVLLDAERQQHHNEKLRHCLWKPRDIFYDAKDDVIDDFNKCEGLRKQVANINLPEIDC